MPPQVKRLEAYCTQYCSVRNMQAFECGIYNRARTRICNSVDDAPPLACEDTFVSQLGDQKYQSEEDWWNTTELQYH
jgi:hypothetical protein